MATTVLLLDSQVVLWVLDDNPKLGTQARELIISSSGAYVSTITLWELTIKEMRGKLTVPDKLSGQLADSGLLLLNVTVNVADGLWDFPELIGHDLFNRLLVAQASQARLQLLTTDRVLLALDRKFIVDATA
jgi:PIN domain nuclease of toxin-antitoxin system